MLGPYVYSRAVSPWQALEVQVLAGANDVAESSDPKALRIGCYNIAHGRGLAESNHAGGTPEARRKRLDDIASLLVEIDADVIVLNEVDFNASWSHSIDQAVYLANKANYRFVAKLSNLDFRLAHRSWRFGNAVLSRYPIRDAYEIDLPGYAAWETVSAGKKRSLFCEIEVDGFPLGVVALHLSHRSEALRVASADRLIEFAKNYGSPLIMAGDFNSTPSGFPGFRTDSQGNNAMDRLEKAGLFQRFPNSSPEDSSQYTFPSDSPRRVIDWVLATDEFEVVDGLVEPSVLSDHRPVVVDLLIDDSHRR